MSVSAFHRNFQAVTAMTPIQFQKHIRLQAARLLLANRPNDITGVGHRVGYDSPSQFSREYRRQFGAPPSVDAVRMHGGVRTRCCGAAMKTAERRGLCKHARGSCWPGARGVVSMEVPEPHSESGGHHHHAGGRS